MGKAVFTEGQAPTEAGEPAEFGTGGAMDNTSRCPGKADNLENDPGGIKKGMGPEAVTGEERFDSGYRMPAIPADHGLFLFAFFSRFCCRDGAKPPLPVPIPQQQTRPVKTPCRDDCPILLTGKFDMHGSTPIARR